MDHVMRSVARLSMAMAVALTVGCQGPEGPSGPAGQNGTNGTLGTAGTNGTNGATGANGAPCTVAPYDGGVTVSCLNSAPVDVPNGSNGASCTIANIDGGVVVSCPGSSPVTVLNGSNGTSGTNGTNGQTGLGLSSGLKVSVTSVSSTSPVTVRFRVMDDRGNPVDLNGNYSINTPFVPRFSLAFIPSTDAGVVLAYKVYTKTGSATAALTTDVAPDPAAVVVTPTAISPTFPLPTAGVPSTDAAMKGLLVENGTGFGDYTYTFPTGGNTQLKNSSNKFVTTVTAPGAYDPTKLGVTHTLWIQIARQTDLQNPNTVQGFTPLDVEYNFIPNGVGTPTKREIVTTAACSNCHNGFKRDLNPNLTLATVNGFHGGGRVAAPFCNVCHNPDRTTNPSANSAVFVHRLHGAHSLVANADGGVPVDAFHGIQVGYPQDVRNCAACHAGALQGNQAYTRPTMEACGSCHDQVDFVAGSTLPACTNPSTRDAEGRFVPCKHKGGAQADSANCAVCHGGATSVVPLATSHLAVLPPDPTASQLLPAGGYGLPDGGAANNNTNASFVAAANAIPPDATVITYDLKSVQLVTGTDGGMNPQLTFKLKSSVNGAAATDVDFGTYAAGTNTELIPGFVGSPSAYFAFSLPQDGIGAPSDFNGSASCYIKNAWNGSVATSCTLGPKDATTGYYALQIVNVNVPPSAKMLTGGLGYTYGISTTRPLTQVNLAAYPYTAATQVGGLSVPAPNVWKVATGFTGRRPIVETARCNSCHAQLGVGPTFHAGQRNDGPTCTFCHNPNRTSSAWAANAKDFIHSIHGGRVRTVSFSWHSISESENYGEVEFPSNINNCQACHAPGTFDFTLASTAAAFDTMLPSTAATGVLNRNPATNPTWFTIAPAQYVTADNVTDYGYGYSTSNVIASLPNATSGTQGGTACTPAAPCTCTTANACTLTVSTPVTVNNVAVNFTQKIGTVTTGCNGTTPCTCTSAQPCTGIVATCSLATPCEAQPTTLVKSPITAACSACHDATRTIAHMKAMGGSFYDTRASNAGKSEQCLICHGPGTIAAITNMHK